MSYEKTKSVSSSSGLTIGAALAITISWSLHQSVLWGVIHGMFGWFYIIYYMITR